MDGKKAMKSGQLSRMAHSPTFLLDVAMKKNRQEPLNKTETKMTRELLLENRNKELKGLPPLLRWGSLQGLLSRIPSLL